MAGAGRKGQEQSSYPEQLPAFLRQSRADIANRFIDLEWQQRNRLAASLQPAQNHNPSPWARLSGDDVSSRNRYVNVEPFAANRVKLRVPPGVNDYINASPIALGNRRYIATQGPKDTSTSHFYRMLASETSSPAVVIMLTQTYEAGREKCYPYFPSSPQTPLVLSADPGYPQDTFEGTVTLLSTEEDAKSRSTIRRLLLRTRENAEAEWQEMEVYHCLFSGWPDFAIPEGENKDAMLELISLSARLNTAPSAPASTSFPAYEEEATAGAKQGEVDSAPQPPSSLNPRIVHCSAGVGRSGTFIALDYLFVQLEVGALDSVPDDRDLIAETVDKLRQQRMMMVQSEGQFIFLYEVLREAWLQRWRAKQEAATAAAEAAAITAESAQS